MATNVTSVIRHFPNAQNGFSTTLSSGISAGATTVPLQSVGQYADGDAVVLIVEPTSATAKQAFTGTVDTANTRLINVIWTSNINGSDSSHNLGATVVDWVTATHLSMITKGIRVDHLPSGAHKFTTVYDPNNSTLETLKLVGVASAVNELTATNAITGTAPSLSATGGDTNIGVEIIAKGTGNVNLKSGTAGFVQKNGNKIDGYEEIGRTVLGGAGDTISVASLPARRHLHIVFIGLNSGAIDAAIRFNNDSGANYTYRRSSNGGADATSTSTTGIPVKQDNLSYPVYATMDIINIAAQEKQIIITSMVQNTAGAANVPGRSEVVAKWANTSVAISQFDIINAQAGDFAIGSEIIVYGHD